MTPKSPCTDVCQFDPHMRWCAGCGRTLEEIRSWRKLTPFRQRVILNELERRMTWLRAEAEVSSARRADPADDNS